MKNLQDGRNQWADDRDSKHSARSSTTSSTSERSDTIVPPGVTAEELERLHRFSTHALAAYGLMFNGVKEFYSAIVYSVDRAVIMGKVRSPPHKNALSMQEHIDLLQLSLTTPKLVSPLRFFSH